jgi:hypothetical protein
LLYEQDGKPRLAQARQGFEDVIDGHWRQAE